MATVPTTPTRPPPIHTPSYPFHQTLPPPSPSPSPSMTYSGSHIKSNASTGSAPSTASTSLYGFPSPTKSIPTTPNAHPYAIKTTSTALLSRSSSSAAQAANASHRYVPPASPAPASPSTSSSHGGEDDDVDAQRPAAGSMGLGRRGKHRYTRSLTEGQPSPMPVPPGVTNNASNNYNGYIPPSAGTPSYRVRDRARSFASEDGEEETPKRRTGGTEMGPPGSPLWGATQKHSTYTGSGTNGSLMELSLPGDPKSWSVHQVAGYLTALLRGGEDDDVAGSLARYVNEKDISGKAFLRLSEGDLDRSDISLTPLARETLLRASRALRQTALRERILPSRSSFSSNSPFEMNEQNSDNEEDDNHVGTADSVTLRRNTRNSKARTPGRSRNSSMSSSTSSSASASSGRVRNIVEGLERSSSIASSASGGGGGCRKDTGEMEEEGSTSSRSVSPVKSYHPAIHGSPTKRNGTSVRHAEGMSPSKHASVSGSRALPVRPSVTDIFGGGGGGSFGPGIARETSGERDVEEKERDETVGKVVRKNVNGREPRLLPFPPANVGGVNGGITPLHTGVNLPLPSSPEIYPQIQQQLTGHYNHHQQYQLPHPQHHLQQQYSGPGDYELGFRHAASPHAAAFVVRHGPSPSNLASPPNNATSASPHPDSSGASGRPARLLPYPPLTAETALHHPRPRRAVGVSDRDAAGDADVEDEEEQVKEVREKSERVTSATSGEDVYVSAFETPDESELSDVMSGREGKEKEKSVAELLADMEAQAQTHEGLQHSMSAPPAQSVTGAQAWEMEMGDTVKRVAGGGSGVMAGKKSEKKKREMEKEKESLKRPGVMNLFGDVEKRERDVGEREDGVEKRTEVGRREKEVEQEQKGGEERQTESEERMRKENEERQRLAEVKMKEVEVKMSEVRQKTDELETRAKMVEDRAMEVDGARLEVESKAKEVDERLKSLDERQAELDIRERALGEREEAVSRREKNVEEEVEKMQEREHELNLRVQRIADDEKALEQREESLEIRLQDIIKREEAVWNKEESLDVREKALEKAEEGLRSATCELGLREEKLGARVDEVKSGEERLSVREERLREREAALRVLEENAALKAAVPTNGHAAAASPPSVAEKPTTPLMKQATMLDDQASSPGTAILRQCWSTFVLPVVGENRTPAFLRSPGAATKEEPALAVGADNAPPKDTVDQTPGSSSFIRRYLVPTWTIRRDAIIGRFMGPDGGLTDNYLVLMGIGMCVVVLRVLGRRAAWAMRK